MDSKFLQADELGMRLEIVGGLPIWEAQPLYRHQKAVDRIRKNLDKPQSGDCHCVDIAGVYISFPDGSLKRPDIAIYCREPDEQDAAITLIPEAVIEVISKGYEAKDLEIGPRFYLSQGIKDIVVFDPYTLMVLRLRKDKAARQVSPVEISLQCGCRCIV